MKARMKFNETQQSAFNKEVNRQLAEQTRVHESDIDAILLWFMHEEYGWGTKRLNDMITKFNARLRELTNWYEMDDTDQLFLIKHQLEEMGIDVESLGKTK